MDGFSIENGQADFSSGPPQFQGAAVFIDGNGSSTLPTFANCIFRKNEAVPSSMIQLNA